jgi:hypothetical protein
VTHYKSLIDTTCLGQWDLPADRDVVVLIAKVEKYAPEVRKKKKLPDGTYVDEPIKRVRISFQGKKKSWLAGPVSQQAIAGIYGPQIENWIGKPIALYVDTEVTMGRTKTGGVRVRPRVPNGAQATSDPLDRPVDERLLAEMERAEAGT